MSTSKALSRLPDPPEERQILFKDLSGGLNLRELDYRMDPDQSPEMLNLWWRDGVLGCRDGQEFCSDTALGRGICCYERLFGGSAVMHIEDGLYAAVPGPAMALRRLCGGLPAERGTFLRYRDVLLYKTKGAYKQLRWEDGALLAEDVTPYVPVTVINCSPEGAGDLYQPENRLSPQKTVWYTVARTTGGVSFTADGTAVQFRYETQSGEPVASVEQVYRNETLLLMPEYSLSEDLRTVIFPEAPAEGSRISVVYTEMVRTYRLPVTEVASVDRVELDGEAVTDFTADLQTGLITFSKAPARQDPPVNNTLRITYSKADPDAEKSIMDCRYAIAYGGTGGAVLVMAGSEAQPNACFWNGSHIAMDPGYFPMSHYNLVGDTREAVTAFGQQAGYLVVFKENSVGRCLMNTEMIGDRAYLTLDYTPVNAVLGCDLPWTVRLAGNNLVWCSTYAGVCRLEDTTAALENQVSCLSRNVNGSGSAPGLLQMVRTRSPVCALEDGERYWVCADGEAFLWDHSLSSPARPSWFRFSGIGAVSFFRGDSDADGVPAPGYTGPRQIFHLDGEGRVTAFVRSFRDYGGPIRKVFRFATQNFGTCARLKNVRSVLLTTRSDTDTVIRVSYDTDLQRREDLTPITCRSWRLAPRNLAFRCLAVRKFAHVALRRPNCRHVQHFSLYLENNEPGCDMSIVSARMTAALVRRQR